MTDGMHVFEVVYKARPGNGQEMEEVARFQVSAPDSSEGLKTLYAAAGQWIKAECSAMYRRYDEALGKYPERDKLLAMNGKTVPLADFFLSSEKRSAMDTVRIKTLVSTITNMMQVPAIAGLGIDTVLDKVVVVPAEYREQVRAMVIAQS